MCYDNGDDNILMHDVINIRPVVENIFFDIVLCTRYLLIQKIMTSMYVCLVQVQRISQNISRIIMMTLLYTPRRQ